MKTVMILALATVVSLPVHAKNSPVKKPTQMSVRCASHEDCILFKEYCLVSEEIQPKDRSIGVCVPLKQF